MLSKLKSDFTQPKLQTEVQRFFFFFAHQIFSSDNILQSETVKLNVTKSYILVDVVGVLALVQPAFLCWEIVNLILWTFYINQL